MIMSDAQKGEISKTLGNYGYNEDMSRYPCVLSDDAGSQYHLVLSDGIWLFSEEVHYGDSSCGYKTEVADIKSYSDERLNEMVTSHYPSLDFVKETLGDDWSMIALECGFECDML
ncbi:MAG: Unknown protein [uncultured Sulfurovum sp.]|uniref:Uncharacterized protein n=1 Tax=uncultured Sulfurovum sp. TaxID=269237 RepID=A0A6S6SYY1_9BACT|nr:MAG: Unknown protein [uncultured Sulfurovum sp.]